MVTDLTLTLNVQVLTVLCLSQPWTVDIVLPEGHLLKLQGAVDL